LDDHDKKEHWLEADEAIIGFAKRLLYESTI
jgi:hypothetical protein